MNRTTSLLLAFATLTIAGCGSNESRTVPTVAPTTSTSIPGSTAVLNDYRSFWDDYLAVTNPMTPGNPRIAAHATGDELTKLNGIVVAGKAKGSAFKGTIALAPKVESVSAGDAIVTDCSIDRTGEYAIADDKRLDTEDLTPQNIRVSMKHIDSVWKVASIDHRSEPCTP